MDRKLQQHLKKIYEAQAMAAQGYGRPKKVKKPKAPVGGMVGGMYHPYIHPHMAMYGMGLEYMHPGHPYHMMGHGLVGGAGTNVHHRHHVPPIHEAHHPSKYAMFVKANNAAVRKQLAGHYTGRELNKMVFRQLGQMWHAAVH